MRIFVWQWGKFGVGPRYAYELAGALSDLGHETLLSLAEGAEAMHSPRIRKAVDLPLQTYSTNMQFLQRTLRIRAILRPLLTRLEASPPDAAIVTMTGYWDIFLMRRLRRLGVPVVILIHDAQMHPGDSVRVMVRLQKELVRLSSGVITLSDFVARQLRARMSLANKVQATIPLAALDFTDLDLPPPSLSPPSPERPLRLLMAGRLMRYKGLDLFADALKSIGNDVRLSVRVVGSADDDRDLDSLRAIASVELALGWKSDREIIAHLDWADATVLPYVEASQSGVVPMSFSRGRPVIATPVGGLPEQVQSGKTGIVTEGATPLAIAAAIRTLAEDRQLLRRYAENALHHARDEISWRVLAPAFADTLQKVARH